MTIVERINDRINDRINELQLTQNQIVVFDFIRDSANDSDRIKGGNDRLTVGYISERVNLSAPTVQRIMRVLEQNGLIRRIGSKKTGYWQIVE